MKEFVTLMYFTSKGGEIRSLKIPKKVFSVFFIVVLAIIFLSVYSTFVMFSLYVKNRGLVNELNVLKGKNEGTGKKFVPNQEGLPKENGELNRGDAGIAEAEKGASEDRDEKQKEVRENKVSLENTTVTEIASGKGFKLNFDVVKGENVENKKLTGSVVIVGKMGDKYFTYPSGIEVKDGSPLYYSAVERFDIRYRRIYEKIFPYPLGSVESLAIFVYDEKGDLLLNENVVLR